MPNKFNPIDSNQGTTAALQAINHNFLMLDAEAYTKDITDGSNSQIRFGKLVNERYGLEVFDSGGMPRILIGQAPKDGRVGLWVTKPGFNVENEIN